LFDDCFVVVCEYYSVLLISSVLNLTYYGSVQEAS